MQHLPEKKTGMVQDAIRGLHDNNFNVMQTFKNL